MDKKISQKSQNELRIWREAQGWSQAEMALQLDIASSRTYQRYEIGERPCPVMVAEKLWRLSNGAVSPAHLHQIRLAWVNRKVSQINLEAGTGGAEGPAEKHLGAEE